MQILMQIVAVGNRRLDRLFALLVLLVGLAGAAVPAAAQESDTTEAAPQFTRIPQSQLADHVEEIATRIRDARSLLASDGEVRAIDEGWPAFLSELNELKLESAEGVTAETGANRIDEYIRQWNVRYAQLEAWEDLLSDRLLELEDLIDEFSSSLDRWRYTRDLAIRDSLPAQTIVQLDSVVTASNRTIRELQGDRDITLDLQTRITYENIDAVTARERLVELRGAALAGGFGEQQVPLWELFSESRRPIRLGGSPRLIRDGQITFNYVARHIGYLVLQIFLVLFLTFIFRPLREKLLEIEQEQGFSRIRVSVFDRPYLPAILVVLLATPLLYPNVPSSLVAFTTVVSVPITILMLYHSSLPRAHGLIRGLGLIVGYFVLARLVVPADGLIDRLSMTLLALATAVGSFAFLKRSQLVEFMRSGTLFGRLLLTIARIGFVLSTGVVIADIAGYEAVAEHVLRGMMVGLYSGLYIYVGSQIVSAAYIAFLHTSSAQRSRSIKMYVSSMAGSGVALINFAAFVYWAYISLGLLGLLDPILSAVSDVLNEPWGVGELEITVIDIVAFVLTLWVSIRIARIMRILLSEDVLGRMNMARGLSTAVSSLAFYGMVALGFAFALSAAGVPLDRLALITGALGFGIGFGLQDVVRNFISGLILMIERPVKVGDVVEFGVQSGTVKKVGIRSSIVRIWEGADVIVPNSHLVTNEVKNWTMDDSSLRIDVNIIVTYDSDQHRIAEILQSVGDDYDGVAKNPAPTVVFTGFTERGMNFSLRCWVHERDGWLDKRTDLSAEAHRRLREAGVEFPKIPL